MYLSVDSTKAAELMKDFSLQENNNIGGGGLSAVASGLGEVYDGGSRDKMVKVLKMQEASWPSE